MRKRGQVTPPVTFTSTLIAIIGAAIIVYILMLPPTDRAAFLGQNETNLNDPNYKDNITILLEEEPGTLEFIENDEIEISDLFGV